MMLDLSDLDGVRLLTDYAEAERCWHIFANPAAVARPALAWGSLPLGLPVRETLLNLLSMPIEADPPPDLHAHYLALLTTRRSAALAAWQARNQPRNAHVH